MLLQLYFMTGIEQKHIEKLEGIHKPKIYCISINYHQIQRKLNLLFNQITK